MSRVCLPECWLVNPPTRRCIDMKGCYWIPWSLFTALCWGLRSTSCMTLISRAANRKNCGRLDHKIWLTNQKPTYGKASLADIFFQKLFGKRSGDQNRRYVPICALCAKMCVCHVCAVCVLWSAMYVLYVCYDLPCLCVCQYVCQPIAVSVPKPQETVKSAQIVKRRQKSKIPWKVENPWKPPKQGVYYRPLYTTFHFANDRPSGGPILGFRCTTPHETVIFDPYFWRYPSKFWPPREITGSGAQNRHKKGSQQE